MNIRRLIQLYDHFVCLLYHIWSNDPGVNPIFPAFDNLRPDLDGHRNIVTTADGEDKDNKIRGEILWKCSSTYNKRRKFLEEGQGLTLTHSLLQCLREKRRGFSQSKLYKEGRKRGCGKTNQSCGTKNGNEKTCCRCGRAGHFGRHSNCPARGRLYRRSG